MPGSYLFGPVPASSAEQKLHEQRQVGTCLAFNSAGDVDLLIRAEDDWQTLAGRFPAGWQPDFLVLNLGYTSIPAALWSAPVPIVGLAQDWTLLWHYYRRCLRQCELVLTDTRGALVLQRQGICHALAANLFGCDRSYLEEPWPATERDIDILFVGNFNPAVQRQRLPWLARLAPLARRWNVVLRTGVFGSDYRRLLARSRIVFNQGARSECNMRVFEAAAAGALLFQEADNLEVPAYFRDRQECVYYHADDLEALLEYYLQHEEERRAIAEAARSQAGRYSFAKLWEQHLERIEEQWPALQQRASQRLVPTETDSLQMRLWQMLGSSLGEDPSLALDLQLAVAQQPQAVLHNALGLIAGLGHSPARGHNPAEAALAHFEQALACEPTDVLATLNAAEALASLGRLHEAVARAEQALHPLEQSGSLSLESLDSCHFPPAFDLFRVEWERAAWLHAGQPEGEARAKGDLLRWRLHGMLGQWTGEREHYRQARQARPDLWPSQAALGCALGRAGRPAEAVEPLRIALATNPFDDAAARALYHALGEVGDGAAQQELAEQQRDQATALGVPSRNTWAWESEHAPNSERLCIVWEGDQRAVHSLAGVNRHLCAQLQARGHAVSMLDEEASQFAQRAHPLPRPADVHVRHQWPPQLTAPPTGHWIFMQPWEYGSIPAAWVEPLTRAVDEVWACSQYVRDCYLAAGIPAERVHVVPLGVDCERFHPQAPPLPLPTHKRFKLLFVGGTIYRKGIDLLLDAYCRSFRRSDDVCLVIKDMGTGSFYKGQTAERRIRQLQEQEDAPEILYLDAELSETDLAGLYTACDGLVHPYRGEGFGLPIAEAMACGLPVLVTGLGAALDFCDDSCSYLIPARQVYLPDRRVGDLETVGQPWLAEPDADALAHLLRHVFEYPEEARQRGRNGRQRILDRFTWQHAAAVAEERLRQLCRQPIRRLQPGSAVVASAGPRPTVALCMIVKNEEANLPACLQSVADLVDEIIVVDTGSTDRSREIAASFGAQVHDFAWVDSFAAARNEGLRHARADWIFWLDADDRLDTDNRKRLEALFADLPRDNAAFVMKCLCLPDPESGTATVVDHVRLFRNDPALRWDYRVHEQILPALRRHGHEVRWSDVVIEHTGYQDCSLRRRKLERDRRLLEMEKAERPDDPFVLFNLGALAAEEGRLEDALPLLQRSLQLSHPRDSIVRKLYALVAQCLRRLGQPEQALDACRRGRTLYPDDVELLFQEGVVRREQGDRAGARLCWLQLLQPHSAKHFASIDAGLCGYKVRHNLAHVSLEEGDLAEAERHWRAALAEHPGFTPARLGLAEVQRRRGGSGVVAPWR